MIAAIIMQSTERKRNSVTVAERLAKFEQTDKVAKDVMALEQRLRREKNERLRKAREEAAREGDKC